MLMTMTTCRRFDYWIATIASLKHAVDMDLIDRCLIIDDGSDVGDIARMANAFSVLFRRIKLDIVRNQVDTPYRHAASMRMWRKAIEREQFVFHCEDDWRFESVPLYQPLAWGLRVCQENDWVGQAVLKVFDETRRIPFTAPVSFWVRTQENCYGHWPSRFTLTPTLTRVASLRVVGDFVEGPNCEHEYGVRWSSAGYLAVNHPVGFCRHAGALSAYDVTGNAR